MTSDLQPAPLLSVVVIGRNEGPRLARCLASVAAMQPSLPVETIYVDSGSSDGSLAMAEAAGVRTIALQPSRPTAAIGRNAGWRAAQGNIILFLDGDTILAPRFVAESLASFDDPSIAVVWGHRRELHPSSSLYVRMLDLDWIYSPGPTSFCGGDALFRRDALEATGGFDEALIAGEEPELCCRILARGQRILHVDRMMTGHDLAITRFSQYWRRAVRAGHAFAEVSARFAHSDHPFWLEESRRNRLHALALIVSLSLALLLSLALRNLWPLIAFLAGFTLLAIRSATRAAWKTGNRLVLVLYGFHSHLQQVPIFVGQLQFWRNRRRGSRSALVDYKT